MLQACLVLSNTIFLPTHMTARSQHIGLHSYAIPNTSIWQLDGYSQRSSERGGCAQQSEQDFECCCHDLYVIRNHGCHNSPDPCVKLMILSVSILVLLHLIQLHGPDGQIIDVNANEVSSLREPREGSEGHFPNGTKCIISMTNSK